MTEIKTEKIKETMAKELCLWMAMMLQQGLISAERAEDLALGFTFGLSKSSSRQDFLDYLGGFTGIFSEVTSLINSMARYGVVEKRVETENAAIMYAKSILMTDSSQATAFLVRANQVNDLDVLSKEFPGFHSYRNNLDSTKTL